MNLLYFFPFCLKFKIKSCCSTEKLSKSIDYYSKLNSFIIHEKSPLMNLDKKVHICIMNNYLYMSCCHMYYDAYSIFQILNKIDLVYTNYDLINKNNFNNAGLNLNLNLEFDNLFEENFKIDLLVNALKSIYQSNFFHIIKNFLYTNTISLLTHNKKSSSKILKIKKNKIKSNSNIDIMEYVLKKLFVKKYSMVVNLRKIFPHLDKKLGNLIYICDELKTFSNIRTKIDSDKLLGLDKLRLKVIPSDILLNSYLGFDIPEFLTGFELFGVNLEKNTSRLKSILICPKNTHDKYYIVYYNL